MINFKGDLEMENNFEEKRKDIDISSIDIDSQSLDRKVLELNDKFNSKFMFEEDVYAREYGIANNLSEETERRIKIDGINNDFKKKIDTILTQYEEELVEAIEKYERKIEYPYYFKWTFIGNTKDYDKLFNGLSYYIKKMDDNTIRVYSDVKFNTYLGEFNYVSDDWKPVNGL